MERARFTLEMCLRDNKTRETFRLAVDLGQELRISTRAVDEMRMGVGTFDGTVEMMKRKELRRDLFKLSATRMGTLLADRLEDAEGWHDVSRVEPARKELGGNWER